MHQCWENVLCMWEHQLLLVPTVESAALHEDCRADLLTARLVGLGLVVAATQIVLVVVN